MYNSNEQENEILKFWDEDKTFEKSVSERPESKPYHFYDGPPFATGLPHYGHIVASLEKDVVPRYWTMRGFRVERRWGWDCHGLPIENIIEKDLNLNSKKAIEEYGVAKFNEACRSTVLRYAGEWKKTVKRMGRWVDMENDYKTMDLNYMESVWWVFGELWKQGLIYKGHKAMHICPRCVTPLSNFEVTQGYKDVKDISVTIKFKVKNPEKAGLPEGVCILAWTTTPWTLPGNVLLAVNPEINYSVVAPEGEEGDLVVATERAEKVLVGKQYTIKKTLKGTDLVGLEYEPLFPYFASTPNAFRVVAADFVTITDGTGVVHIAPAFGEDDYKVGKQEGVPLVQHVSMDGRFIEEVEDFAGHEVKPIEEPTATDVEIIKWLAHNGKLFNKEKFEHSYPHCWRCDSPLLNYATSCWFVRVTDLKEQLLKNNEEITWVPEHIKEGRFGDWLEGARDWAISRNRFWGTPLPVWEAEDGEALCVGNVKELEELTGEKVTDLHKHLIDRLEIKKDGKVFRRVPEVLDCWFESGSMPYGQMHYPFENKAKFESGFPAEFIAEGQDQTRGWFYTLHVLATALTLGKDASIKKPKSLPAFKNVIVNGIVLAEDGKKMSKRLKNYPEPDLILEKYGADAMRYFLLTSPVMAAENLNFTELGVREVYNKLINTLWNVVEFYKMYAGDNVGEVKSENVLDKWILTKLQVLIGDVTKGMESYHLVDASRPLVEFVTELSQWYVRRSRDRFKGEDESGKKAAIATLHHVLVVLAKTLAPFTPFIAEKIWLELSGKKTSVHLEAWPEVDEKMLDEKVLSEMVLARKVVELGLAARAETGIKVKQPLQYIRYQSNQLSEQLEKIIAEELNVKEVKHIPEIREENNWVIKEDVNVRIGINTVISEELRDEGLAREFIRLINLKRKDLNLTVSDLAAVTYWTDSLELQRAIANNEAEISRKTLSKKLSLVRDLEGAKEEVGGGKIVVNVERL